MEKRLELIDRDAEGAVAAAEPHSGDLAPLDLPVDRRRVLPPLRSKLLHMQVFRVYGHKQRLSDRYDGARSCLWPIGVTSRLVDEPRLASRYRRVTLDQEARQAVDKAVDASVQATSNGNGATAAAADRWLLRGLPAVGGKDWPGSAIPGTRPGDSLGLNDDDD